ncbi:J domain-containing protein [Klebsiella huaxiensis]|uniref:J domain-containing protein n=1 Tax=Klebsiella huaxiensis TaxID=2153354 RepID=A0A564MBQ7_9ENTR|nr:J domain-containing protein [Klebsiella huaxiensis]MDG1642809.1 J domain-containing protein [Klebsiella huaxiensis]VUS91132.1 Secretory immunoglobulin A-binding protein EsiB [Klebsiella huaxiensis]VUT11124.1 Secretory immunoglobulin A-binding protein EsiB [Klebsiella huaxiensis]
MTCWEILGLEPGAESREIKRRFAQLVKVNRPEDDPQAYQRLRNAYEAALNWEEEDDVFPDEEEHTERDNINIRQDIADIPQPRVQIGLRSPGAVSASLTWQNVLERLFLANEKLPENAQKQLESALYELELLDLKSRIRFEEALLVNLHQISRPLLVLAAAKTFRWHLVAGGAQASIQTAINEGCILYRKIETEIAPYLFAGMSASDEVECGDKIKDSYYSLRDNEKSKKWFDFALLMQVDRLPLSAPFLCQLAELVEWSYKPDKERRTWSLSDRFHALAAVHKQSYRKLINALNVLNNCYASSMVVSSYLSAAVQGHVFSYNKLAQKYYIGADVEKDDTQAAYWFTRAAESGHISAQHNLGTLYRDGVGVEANAQEAFKWFMQAALQGDDKSQYSVGFMYKSGSGIEQNQMLAFEWYLKAAEQGHNWSQLEVAKMLRNGTGVEADLAKAFVWCVKSAEGGYDSAQTELGNMYFNGWGVAQDYHQAREWYLRATEQGESAAQYNLSILYRDGLGVEKNNITSFAWCLKAAKLGFTLAQSELGNKYYDGIGVEQDYTIACEWYKLAAAQGDNASQFNLGKLYKYHLSDARQAVYWLSLVFEQGKYAADAAFMLHEIYLQGDEGVEKDETLGFTWCGWAALNGDKDAQDALSLLYFHGCGTEKSLVDAWAWALISGTVRSKLRIKLLMTPEEISEAQDLAKHIIIQRELESSYYPLP